MNGSHLTILRFTVTERVLHWAFAAGYFALLASGLPLMWPALRQLIRDYTLVIGVRLHLACALLWVLASLGVILLGDRGRLLGTAREFATLSRHDAAWLVRFPRWLVSGREARVCLDKHVGRFNGAQKLNALFVSATSVMLALSGLMLTPAALTGDGSAGPYWREVHRYVTLLALGPLAGHVYLALVHPPTRPALPGIVHGHVDARWAARHHPRWRPPGAEEP